MIEKLNIEVRTRAQELARNKQLMEDVFVLEHFIKTLVLPSAELTANLMASHYQKVGNNSENLRYIHMYVCIYVCMFTIRYLDNWSDAYWRIRKVMYV